MDMKSATCLNTISDRIAFIRSLRLFYTLALSFNSDIKRLNKSRIPCWYTRRFAIAVAVLFATELENGSFQSQNRLRSSKTAFPLIQFCLIEISKNFHNTGIQLMINSYYLPWQTGNILSWPLRQGGQCRFIFPRLPCHQTEIKWSIGILFSVFRSPFSQYL